jgi:hypothetical protein
MVSEASGHGQLAPLRGADGKNITAVGVCGRGGYSPHGGQEAKRQTEERSEDKLCPSKTFHQ